MLQSFYNGEEEVNYGFYVLELGSILERIMNRAFVLHFLICGVCVGIREREHWIPCECGLPKIGSESRSKCDARDLGARPGVAGASRGSRTESWSNLIARPMAAALPRVARSRGLLCCSSWLDDKPVLTNLHP